MVAAPSWFWRVTFLVVAAGAARALGAGRSPTLVPPSPCPQLFYYYEDSRTAQILGALNVPPTFDSVKIIIRVDFIVPVYLKTKYAGHIELVEDKNAVVNRLKQRNLQDIRYSVHFPIQRPLPHLTNLTINDMVICSQTPENIGPSYTKLSMMHVLLMPSSETVPHLLHPGGQINNKAPPRPTPPSTTHSPPTTPIVELEQRFPIHQLDDGCGQAVQVSSLVFKGSPVNRGAWPWLTAIFVTTKTGLEFQCGGTLISKNHIITAGHCVMQQTNKMVKPEALLIYLGKHDLFNWNEQDSQSKDISRIVIHPAYDISSPNKGNDIAVLFLSTPAVFQLNVRPACLWNPQNSYSNSGSVVGWGKDETNQLSKSPKLAVLPIVSQEECLRSKQEFYYFTSNTTLCAGARDGVGPCNGDSGGGMYFKARDTDGADKWFVRALVSLSLQDPTTECDLKNYVVFTDLSKFGDWILEVTGQSQAVR